MTDTDLKLVGRRVDVYYNLHKGGWSVRCKGGKASPENGKVIGYLKGNSVLRLQVERAHVSERGRARVIASGRRSVHAWITGVIVSISPRPAAGPEITYNPYRTAGFTLRSNGADWTPERGDIVAFTGSAVYPRCE